MIKKLLPIFISVFIITGNMLCADASVNELKEVSVKKGANSYTIELTGNRPVSAKKNIISTNRIIVNLDNIDTAKNIKTKFEGHDSIDNIIVDSNGAGKTNIMIQGENIAYSNIHFKELSATEQIKNDIQASFISFYKSATGGSSNGKKFQFGVLFLLAAFIIGELRFIQTKYKELQLERAEIMKNIEATKDFKDYLPGYGKAGIKKPYTTPVYRSSVPVNTNVNNCKSPVSKLPENITLNNILKNTANNENVVIDRIVNNTPVFGTLSGLGTVRTAPKTVSNPIESRIKSNIRHLEAMTAYYKNKASMETAQETISSRLNKVY